MLHACKQLTQTSALNVVGGLGALLLLSSGPAWSQTTEKPGEGITVQPAVPTYLESLFLSDVIVLGLEELGYTVAEGRELDPALSLRAVADGDLDFAPSYIERGQRHMFDAAGGEEKLAMVGTIMPRYLESYYIDKATADQYAITTLDQLQDPEIAKLFDSDGDGKANLLGCPAGWSCQERIAHHLKAYDLEDTVEQVSGNYSVLIADTLARYQQGDPVVYFSYTPYWVAAVMEEGKDVEILEVPFTDLPGDQSRFTDEDTSYDGKNYGFAADRYRLVMNKEFGAEHPVAATWFEQVVIPPEAVSEVSRRIKEGEDTREDVLKFAQEWMETNRELVDQWLDAARQAES